MLGLISDRGLQCICDQCDNCGRATAHGVMRRRIDPS